MSSASMTFGHVPEEEPSGFEKRAEVLYRLNEEGELVEAGSGEPVNLEAEGRAAVERALEESAKKYRTKLGVEIAQLMMKEHHPHLESDPMNSRISVSKQDLYDLIIEASVRAQKAVGR